MPAVPEMHNCLSPCSSAGITVGHSLKGRETNQRIEASDAPLVLIKSCTQPKEHCSLPRQPRDTKDRWVSVPIARSSNPRIAKNRPSGIQSTSTLWDDPYCSRGRWKGLCKVTSNILRSTFCIQDCSVKRNWEREGPCFFLPVWWT